MANKKSYKTFPLFYGISPVYLLFLVVIIVLRIIVNKSSEQSFAPFIFAVVSIAFGMTLIRNIIAKLSGYFAHLPVDILAYSKRGKSLHSWWRTADMKPAEFNFKKIYGQAGS